MDTKLTIAEAKRYFDTTDQRFTLASEACERLVQACRGLLEAYAPIMRFAERKRR